MSTKLISYANLSQYDGLIKQIIANGDAPAFKSLSYDSSTRKVSFFTSTDGTGTAVGEITLPDTSNFLEKFDVTAGTGNASVGDYVKVASDGTLESAGDSLPAGDISVTDAGGYFTSTDVEGVLAELAQASSGGVSSKTIYAVETPGGSSDPYSKKYSIYQGANGSSSSPVPAELITEITIAKDMVVEQGSVVDIVYNNGALYDGDTDVTTIIKGADAPGASDAGKYIKLIIANATSDRIYIKATDLVDVYTAEQNATQIQLAISNSNVISAVVVAGSITSTELASDSVVTAKIADENVTLAKLASGVQTSLGLADTAIQEADMTADNVVYIAADPVEGTPAVTVESALQDVYSQIGSSSVADQITAAIEDLDSSTSDLGVTGTSGSVMNAITGLTLADGKISAFDYTTLGSAALQADTYFMKSADYEIASSQDISDLFSSNSGD